MSFITSSLLALSLASSVYTSPLSTSPHYVPAERSGFVPAPFVEENHIHGTVNNSYIVMLKESYTTPALFNNHLNFLQTKHAESPLLGDNSGLRHIYKTGGYAGYFHDDVIDQVRSLPEVDYVERDQVVRTSDEVLADDSISVQKRAPWGLARISHRKKLGLSSFNKYNSDLSAGDGVDVYIIDTGIDWTHPEFEGRAHWGTTIPDNDQDIDANGHGTHCAGTIASKSYGVAKQANVYAVKVLGSNGSGTMSDVIAGVEWASESASQKADEAVKSSNSKHKGSVANMSLGGGKSPTLDRVVNAASDRGLFFAVAAGNENADACKSSPAAAEKAITVGASTLGDERAYFSNIGTCVDVFAPGLNIKSTWPGNDTNTISGTSMASPHTAGLAAYLLSIYPSATFNPSFSPDFGAPLLESASEHPFATMYRVAHAALPRFITDFLPSVAVLEAVAPVPPKTPKRLTPAQLKQAIIQLSLKDKLAKLPANTRNRLIFNNATLP
jgi:cerevisin